MKIWYSTFNNGNEPAFYRSDDFNGVEVIEKNWSEIKSELSAHLVSNPRLNPCIEK